MRGRPRPSSRGWPTRVRVRRARDARVRRVPRGPADAGADGAGRSSSRNGTWSRHRGPRAPCYTTPGSIHGLELMWSGRLDEARAVLERSSRSTSSTRCTRSARRSSAISPSSSAAPGGGSSPSATPPSRWTSSRSPARARRSATSSCSTRPGRRRSSAEVDEAREMATTGVRLAEANDDRFNGAWNHAVSGSSSSRVGVGRRPASISRRPLEWVEQLGSVELGVIPCLPDLVEALVALGRLEEAERRRRGSRRRRPGEIVRGLRAQRLAGGRCSPRAGGDLDGAARAAERSIEELERAGQPFETARSWLVLGRDPAAREAAAACARGARRERETTSRARRPPLGERAEAEIGRIGGRIAGRRRADADERRIAELVADGKTNKEVAAILVVAERTVESALTQIYRKLDVRSRTELARRLRPD